MCIASRMDAQFLSEIGFRGFKNWRKGMGKAIGIDLGTTNSAVAILRSDGKPEVLRNQEGDPTTPSVILFQDFGTGEDEPLVGALAKRQAAAFPDDIVQHVKRHMGDPSWIFDSSAGIEYSPEEISAILLKRLKQDAENALGEAVTDAVITVPAYFDDARRTATKQAGKIAGLNVLRVLNEPTAAALSYGIESQAAGTVLVYDLGGGTFDVTILEIKNGTFDVISTDGDRNLGGFDFDNELMNFVLSYLEDQGVKHLTEDSALMADLREKAEFAKKALSSMSNTNIQISANGKHFKIPVSKSDFETATASLLRRTEEIVDDVLDDAGMAWNQIDHVLLIGGSTRMPMVKSLVERASGKLVELDVNPDEAVALGAAVQAVQSQLEEFEKSGTSTNGSDLNGTLGLLGGQEIVISDVTSQSLGVIMNDPDTGEQMNSVVIPRNSKIPSKHTVGGRTVGDNQTELLIRVTQGDGADLDYVTTIGKSVLRIPPYPKGAPIEIIYYYDIDQTVGIEVFDLTANTSLGTFEIDRTANLDEKQVSISTHKINDINVG